MWMKAAWRGQPNADSKSDLPIETVRRLCCDGSVVAVTESKESSAAKIRVPAEAADDVPIGSSKDSHNSTLTDLVDDPSRDAFALAPAVSSNGSTGVIPAVTPVDSPNGALTDLAGNPSRDAFAIPPANALNAAAGRSRPSQNLSRKHRLVQPALRRALEARDRACRFPGFMWRAGLCGVPSLTLGFN